MRPDVSWWDQLDPGFISPVWLWLIPVVLAVLFFLERGTWLYRQKALRHFLAPHLIAPLTRGVSQRKRLAKALLFAAALTCLFLALARPHLFFRWQEQTSSGIDILLAVDCSKSMLTQDVLPSRLERAKLAITDLADGLPNCRLGLIAFAGDAFLECPPTLDHEAFEDAVQDLDTTVISRPGTDIASAIEEAQEALRDQPGSSKILILVTDGEDLEGRVLSAALAAGQDGLKIFTVGVGTAAGGRIPEGDQTYLRYEGEEVVSRLDESTLSQIAASTGGAYAPLGQQGQGLEYIYQKYLAPLRQKPETEQRQKRPYEQFMYPLGLALLLLMAEFMLGDRMNSRRPGMSRGIDHWAGLGASGPSSSPPSVVPLALAGMVLWSAGLFSASADSPEEDYQNHRYEQAEEGFQKVLADDPDQPQWQYDLGDAAYRMKDYHVAENAFRRALLTPDLSLQERAYYNLGNTQFRRGEELLMTDPNRSIKAWRQALHSYQMAIELHDSPAAEHNYSYVKKRLEELKMVRAEQRKSDKESQGDADSSSPGSSSSGEGKSGSRSREGTMSEDPDDSQDLSGNGSGDSAEQDARRQSKGGDNDRSGEKRTDGSADRNQGQAEANGASQGTKQSDKTRNKEEAHSRERDQDMQSAEVKSRQEAIELLDSLKGEERRLDSRSYNNDQQPPPPSGKDW